MDIEQKTCFILEGWKFNIIKIEASHHLTI